MSKKYGIIIDYLFIILGSLLTAFGINLFFVPNHIAAGGASGVGTILYVEFSIPVAATVLVINFILFLVGYKTMTKKEFIRTVFGVIFLTIFLYVTEDVVHMTDDLLLASIYGGLLSGFGIGLVVSRNGATGGTDFLAMLLNKAFPQISVANFILIADIIVIVSSGIIFGDYTIMLYEVIALYITILIADKVISGINYAKSIYIISEKSEIIGKEIIEKLDRGVTAIYGRGLYKNTKYSILMCIIKNRELPKLKMLVKNIDASAFIILSDAREVLGEGFKSCN